jgi:hypothetical protein
MGNWADYTLRRNCPLKHVTEGKIEEKIEVTGIRGKGHDLEEKRGYWILKEEALDRTLWRTRLGRGYGPVLRQQNSMNC